MNRSRVTGNLSSHGILFSDITNDRVGIGSTIPTQKLDVTGTVKATTFVGDGSSLTGIDATTIKHTDGNIKAQAIATGVNITGNLAINADSSQPSGNSATNYLSVGASQDLKLYHNGNQNYITAADGTLLIQADNIMLVSDDTAGRSLYQDNANSRLELGFDGTAAAYFSSSSIQFIKPVSSTGNLTITNNNPKISLTDSDGDDYSIDLNSGILRIKDETDSGAVRFSIDDTGNTTIHRHCTVSLNLSVAGSTTSTGNVTAPLLQISPASGNDGIILLNSAGGQNNDFSRIRQAIADDSFIIENKASGAYESIFKGNSDRGAELHFQGSKKLETLTGGVSVTGNITGTGDLTLTDTTADSAAGPEFKLFRNSASPADADYIGQIKFAGESDTGVERNYAKITGKILDASNGTEDGIIEFAHIKAGSQTITGRWRSDSLQLLNGTALTVAGSTTVTGNIIPSSDSATDIGTNGVRFANIYADTLYGDGSNLTGITQTTINSNADNRVITGSGTANTLNAESGLTFSDRLTIDTSINQKIILQGATHPYIHFYEGTTAKAYMQWHADGYVRIRNDEDGSTIMLKDDIQFSPDSQTNNYKIWHAGNDGGASGLDADTVDGIQASSFLRSDTADQMSATLTVDRIDVYGTHGIDNESWYRNDDSGDGMYNTTTQQHFYSDDNDYWNIAGGGSANGLRFRDGWNTTIRGYVYANNSNQIGFLNNNAAWALRVETAGITKLGSNGAGYQIKDGNVANNLYIFGAANGGTDSAGISLYNGAGTWRMQLYGSNGGYYGFLDANWGGWDIQKVVNGAFKVDEGSGLQRVWNAGNDGSGSGLDADTVDGLSAASFVRADTSDIVTGAPWQLTNSGTSGWGFRLLNNTGTNNYVYFCHGTHGMHLRNDSAGTSQYLLEVYRSSSAYFKIRGGDCYTTLAGGMQITGTLSSARVHVQAHSDIRLTNGNWTGDYSSKIQMHSNYLYIQAGSNGHIFRRHTGANAWFITGDGHFHPGTNDAYDIGTSSNRVRNVYTTDLQLSNESKKDRGGNDVDGSWGDWTLQEGEDKIFMINNRTGKKYSLIMKEEN